MRNMLCFALKHDKAPKKKVKKIIKRDFIKVINICYTMREFHGMVGRSWLKRSVKPNSSTTQLSLSHSMMVLSKSKTTTIPAMIEFALFFKV